MTDDRKPVPIPDGAQAVVRAFSILELVLSEESPIRLAEIAERLHLHRNTAYRLVRTLAAMGYIEFVDGSYAVGPKAIAFGRSAGLRSLLLRKCRPHLQTLSNQLGEVTNLAVLNGDEVLYLGRWEQSDTTAGLYVRSGQEAPLYASALGKVFLASWSSDERREYYQRCPFVAHTPHTLTSSEALEAAVVEVKQYGFAEDLEELMVGVRCLAVPIVVHGITIAAFSTAIPVFRFHSAEKIHYVKLLKGTAMKISADLSEQRSGLSPFDGGSALRE